MEEFQNRIIMEIWV